MKKILLLFPVCLMLISCKDKEEVTESPVIPVSTTAYTLMEEDVVNKYGDITNLERFEAFVGHVEGSTSDKVRIVSYTTEGDAIYKDLIYNDNIIMYTIDSTQDRYGEQTVAATTCQSIEKLETSELSVYKLIACEEELDDLLLIIEK